MNGLDIVIIVLLVIPVFLGLKVGLIKAALSLAGVIVGVILAGQYHEALADKISFIAQANVANIIAFAIILIVVMIAATVLATLLKWAVSAVLLGWVNRLGGAIFGLLLGAIFCGALLTIWIKFLGIVEPITESTLATILLNRFPLILTLLPEEFDAVRSFFQ